METLIFTKEGVKHTSDTHEGRGAVQLLTDVPHCEAFIEVHVNGIWYNNKLPIHVYRNIVFPIFPNGAKWRIVVNGATEVEGNFEAADTTSGSSNPNIENLQRQIDEQARLNEEQQKQIDTNTQINESQQTTLDTDLKPISDEDYQAIRGIIK